MPSKPPRSPSPPGVTDDAQRTKLAVAPAAGPDDEKASDDATVDSELAALRQLEAANKDDAPLRHLRRLEELTWQADSDAWSVRNLGWILRSKRRELELRIATERSEAAITARRALTVVLGAVAIACGGWILAWWFLKDIRSDWPALLATSAVVLLLLGAATLLFRVSRDSHRRSLRYADDLERVHRLEVAVRLGLASTQPAAALGSLAAQIVALPRAEGDAPDQLTAVPELLTEVGRLFGETAARLKK